MAENEQMLNTVTISDEESALPKGYRDYLTFPERAFVPAQTEDLADSFTLTLNAEGLSEAVNLTQGDGPERYRFLIACAGLTDLLPEYSVSLDPENLMYDQNFMPKIKVRGAAAEGEDAFLAEYKALICAILAPKRSYADYLKGGMDLMGRDKLLSEISGLEDAESVKKRLAEELAVLEKKLKSDSMLVSKSANRTKTILMAVFICLFAAVAGYGIKYALVDIPNQQAALSASNAFLAGDYTKVLSSLSAAPLDSLTKEERYMAAYAGASTASLSQDQKNTVLAGVTLNADSLYLNYWVEQGRGNYSDAVDISKRIGDTQLELYGLLMQKSATEANMSISGAEKAAVLKTLTDQITELSKQTGTDAAGTNGQ